MSRQADSWACSLKFFTPSSTPLLPGGMKFPSWSGTNLFSSSLQYFSFILAKKTSLTNSPCQKASYVIHSCAPRADAFSEGKQAGRVEGLGQRHQGDDRSLVVRGLLTIGSLSDNTERMSEQRIHFAKSSFFSILVSKDKVVNTLNSAELFRFPWCRELGAADPWKTTCQGIFASQPYKSSREMDQRVTGFWEAAS